MLRRTIHDTIIRNARARQFNINKEMVTKLVRKKQSQNILLINTAV